MGAPVVEGDIDRVPDDTALYVTVKPPDPDSGLGRVFAGGTSRVVKASTWVAEAVQLVRDKRRPGGVVLSIAGAYRVAILRPLLEQLAALGPLHLVVARMIPSKVPQLVQRLSASTRAAFDRILAEKIDGRAALIREAVAGLIRTSGCSGLSKVFDFSDLEGAFDDAVRSRALAALRSCECVQTDIDLLEALVLLIVDVQGPEPGWLEIVLKPTGTPLAAETVEDLAKALAAMPAEQRRAGVRL